ncbi:acetyl-CoA hydrolase/transferase C-terminal domain-containing protein [Mycobacterium sp. NAZ190054]|uniref:acetyl-CoA hydrolase/transferase C-terminal domain-containing protein n=1 Tax=Mycobacterium sp. NAZ190054 TaxID=1747766 RepID=UPI0012E36DC7|nr:acetyl-CoA hydrolase/transferase C-terminal domain-containing protein [Mycobacterium sp. NAZ190054]
MPIVTPDEAVQCVGKGSHIGLPIGIEATDLIDAIVRRAGVVGGVEVTACGPQQSWASLQRAVAGGHATVVLDMITGAAGAALADGRVAYGPTAFSALAAPAPSQRRCRFDVVPVVVSEPDQDGYVSLGHTPFNKLTYIEQSRHVLGEIDSKQRDMFGSARLHVSQFSALVQHSGGPSSYAPARVPAQSDVARQIADWVRSLIPDGATVQVGPGKILSALAGFGVFDDANDLGIHAPVIDAALLPRVLAGHFPGSAKTVNKGKVTTSGLLSTVDADLDAASRTPSLELHDMRYVVDIGRIASQHRMVAINGALGVDLKGQIASDSWGQRAFGGAGGQVEFTIGAALSPGGRSIIVLPSTALGGSTIVENLPTGTGVTVTSAWADTVVTEFGVAELRGRSANERRDALIAIAHPDHRASLGQ